MGTGKSDDTGAYSLWDNVFIDLTRVWGLCPQNIFDHALLPYENALFKFEYSPYTRMMYK